MSPRKAWVLALLAVAAGSAPAAGQTADTGAAAGQPRGDAGTQQLPAGHPRVDPTSPGADDVDADEDDGLPSQHPAQSNPHGGGSTPGAFEPPPDTTDDDGSLPAGVILIETRDADNRPLPHAGITLGIMHQTVAKGESREHRAVTSDDKGTARFDGLETGSGIAYRVTVPVDGATFAAMPFQLGQTKGMHVVLHVYPVVHDLQRAVVVMQAVVFAELKDDRVQLEEAITIYNFGRTAWVPDNVILTLPSAFTALTANQQMGDQGVDPVDGQGARLKGTFAPGRRDIEFRWQIPNTGDRDLEFDIGLPPHVAVMRVMALASQSMRLVVDGFPDAQKQTDPQGQRLLLTEKQLRKEDTPLTSAHVSLRDLPVPGPGRYIAAGIAALGVTFGLVFAFASSPPKPRRGKATRAQLLAELENVERAHAAGDIGPRTYDRARRELIDAIAGTLVTS